MSNFTELFQKANSIEVMPSNSSSITSEFNDNQEEISYTTLEADRNSMTYENNDILKEILKNTVAIKQSIKDLSSRIEKLEEDNKNMHSRQLTELTMTQKLLKPKKVTLILKSPYNSVEELEKFEDNVKKSPELSEKLEDEIFKQGGSDPSKFIRLIPRKVIIDKVASQYSWKGTQKKAVDVMAVTNAFRGAFNRKFVGSDKEFSRASAKWFQTSKERVSKNIKK